MLNNKVINNTNNSLGSVLRNSCSRNFILFSSNKPGFIKKGIRCNELTVRRLRK